MKKTGSTGRRSIRESKKTRDDVLGLQATTKAEAERVLDKVWTAPEFGKRFHPCETEKPIQELFGGGKNVFQIIGSRQESMYDKLWVGTKMIPWNFSGRVAFRSIKRIAWFYGIDAEVEQHLREGSAEITDDVFVRGLRLGKAPVEFVFIQMLRLWRRRNVRFVFHILRLAGKLETGIDPRNWQLRTMQSMLRRARRHGMETE